MPDIMTLIETPDPDLFATRFKPFIEQHLEILEHYDALRPEGHPYRFHMHSRRVARNAKALALHLGADEDQAEYLYWATLPHDIGKMRLPVALWDSEGKPSKQVKAARRAHTLTGFRMIEEAFNDLAGDPFLALMGDIMARHHEALDGSGYLGLTQEDLSIAVQIVACMDAFDGWSSWRPHYKDRDISPAGVITRMRDEKKGQFAPHLIDGLAHLADKEMLCLPSQP